MPGAVIVFSQNFAVVSAREGLVRCLESGICTRLKAFGGAGQVRAVWMSFAGQGMGAIIGEKLGLSSDRGEAAAWRDLPVTTDQVVWLDALEHRYVEEMGGMNLYFVYGAGDKARLVTPELTGSLLPGVTRDSLLTLSADLGYVSSAGRVSTQQWREGNASGEISEVFACGTAAVITPVGAVRSVEHEWTVGDGGTGPVTARLRQALLDIQTGVAADQHGWVHPLASGR